jgi:predicted nucleic acid-binding protein
MPADCFFDTSVLVYTVAHADHRSAVAEELLLRGGWISVQVLNELVAVAKRKLGMNWQEISEATANIRTLCEAPVPLTMDTHDEARRISERYGYHFYDSLVIASAAEAGCSVLYAEDMQDDQMVGTVCIRNPFADGS